MFAFDDHDDDGEGGLMMAAKICGGNSFLARLQLIALIWNECAISIMWLILFQNVRKPCSTWDIPKWASIHDVGKFLTLVPPKTDSEKHLYYRIRTRKLP